MICVLHMRKQNLNGGKQLPTSYTLNTWQSWDLNSSVPDS
jgi:hypothetical protein